MPDETIEPGSTDDYCSDPLGPDHDYMSTKPAGVHAWVRWCRLCQHIDGRDLNETLAAAREQGRAERDGEVADLHTSVALQHQETLWARDEIARQRALEEQLAEALDESLGRTKEGDKERLALRAERDHLKRLLTISEEQRGELLDLADRGTKAIEELGAERDAARAELATLTALHAELAAAARAFAPDLLEIFATWLGGFVWRGDGLARRDAFFAAVAALPAQTKETTDGQ